MFGRLWDKFIRLYPYSAAWDKFLNDAMDRGDVTYIDEYRSDVGGVLVWTSNYPYAYAHTVYGSRVMPSRKTSDRLFNMLVMCGSVKEVR